MSAVLVLVVGNGSPPFRMNSRTKGDGINSMILTRKRPQAMYGVFQIDR